IVQSQIIENWEAVDEPVHLKTIRDRLLRNQHRASRLLGLYQKILTLSDQGEICRGGAPVPAPAPVPTPGGIEADNTPEQTELRLSGLVVKRGSKLTVNNRIYAAIFNEKWVEKSLCDLRPYAESLTAWIASNCQDESRLLRGQALQDAREWAADKSLSTQDYQFLAASQEAEFAELHDREQKNQAEIELLRREKQLLEELSAEQELRKSTQIKLWREERLKVQIFSVSSILLISILIAAFWVKPSIEERNHKILTLCLFSETLFAANKKPEALIEAIKAAKEMNRSLGVRSNLQVRVLTALDRAIFSFKQRPILPILMSNLGLLNFSPDSQLLVAASDDRTLKIWHRDGSLKAVLKGHSDRIINVSFSPDSQRLVAVSEDNTVKIWQVDGKLMQTFPAESDRVNGIISNQQSSIITSGIAGDNFKTWKLPHWEIDGTSIEPFPRHKSAAGSVIVSPDGRAIASVSNDGKVMLWNLNAEDLLVQGCNLTRNSSQVQSAINEIDRHLCDEISDK
ncbi:MAG: WD40 repeat domain-containing protein, partial [Microcoleus sp.]